MICHTRVILLLVGMWGCHGWASAACHIATTEINFGPYNVFHTADVRSTSYLTVTCDLVPPARVTLAFGPSAHSGRVMPRGLRFGSHVLQYNLYSDSALTHVWGDGTSGGSPVMHTVRKSIPLVVPVYGTIPAQQDVRAGVYSDQVTVTITW